MPRPATTLDRKVTCGFCGHVFYLGEATDSCDACPLHSHCGKVMCPNCGFELPVPPPIPWPVSLFRRLKERVLS